MPHARGKERPADDVTSVIDRVARRIDLSQQDNAVNAAVLEDLRDVLHLNDFYVSLSLSHNVLRDDSMAMLCAMLKDKTYLETLELQDCGLRNKDFTFYLVPALLSRNTVKHIDLSKNPDLTDESVEAVCRLIREGDMVTLRLQGTSLTPAGGRKVVEAMSTNGSLEVCELPYTVGFAILDRVAAFVARNHHHLDMVRDRHERQTKLEDELEAANESINNTLLDRVMASPMAMLHEGSPLRDAKSRAKHASKQRKAATAPSASGNPVRNVGLAVGPVKQDKYDLVHYRADRGRKNALHSGVNYARRGGDSTSLLPLLSQHSRILCRHPSSTQSQRLPPLPGEPAHLGSASPHCTLAPHHNADIGSLDNVRLRDWVDPAVRTALTQLHLLSERSKLRDEYRALARNQLREQRGLGDTDASVRSQGVRAMR